MPSLTATQSFTVIVVPPPGNLTISRTNNTEVILTWQTYPGKTYQVQSIATADAPANTWTNVGAPLPAAGYLLNYTDTIAPDAQRFYRIRQLQP